MPSEHGAAHAAAVYLMEQYEEAQRHNSTPRSPTSPRGARGTSTRASRSRGSSPRYQTRSAASSISPRSTWAGRRDGGTLCRAPVPPRGLVSWTAGGVAMRSRPATAGPDPAFDLPVVYGRYTAPEYANDPKLLLRKSRVSRFMDAEHAGYSLAPSTIDESVSGKDSGVDTLQDIDNKHIGMSDRVRVSLDTTIGHEMRCTYEVVPWRQRMRKLHSLGIHNITELEDTMAVRRSPRGSVYTAPVYPLY